MLLPCSTAKLPEHIVDGNRFVRRFVVREEYTRSRRSRAPRSPGSLQLSYACSIRRFSAGEIVRLRLISWTSGWAFGDGGLNDGIHGTVLPYAL